jgi:hypothetical protein
MKFYVTQERLDELRADGMPEHEITRRMKITFGPTTICAQCKNAFDKHRGHDRACPLLGTLNRKTGEMKFSVDTRFVARPRDRERALQSMEKKFGNSGWGIW